MTLQDASEAPILTAAMRRDRWIVIAALTLACALAWLWLVQQARGMPGGAAASQVGGKTMGAAASPPPFSLAYWLSAFGMWALMMVAMMLPSAAPMILIYARMAAQRRAGAAATVPALAFAGVYVLVWTAFSALAALGQGLLAGYGALSASRLAIGDHRLAGAMLLVVGAYELTPLKDVCLGQCRSPVGLIAQHWRPGWRGVLGLGLRHAVYCIGCCWALMALLFVGGVMNLTWVALLALIVTAEKIAPAGRLGSRVVGVAAAALGLFLVAAPALRLP